MKRYFLLAAGALIMAQGFSPAVVAQSRTIAFTGARLIDGTDKRPIDNATVVVRDGKIAAIGGPGTAIPNGATRVSLAGKTVIPGLVNAHGHVGNTVGMQ